MEIWLSENAAHKLRIPVNPEEMGGEDSRNFEDVTLASGDEKTIITGRSLRTYSISSFFPVYRPYYVDETFFMEPMAYVDTIRDWMDKKKVLLLQVTGLGINEAVTIRSFNWKEVGGAVGDIEYDISFKEYQPVQYTKSSAVTNKTTTVKNQSTKTSTTRPTSSSPKSQLPANYTVVKGDCLWNIAKKYYGDGAQYTKIYNKNKSVIGKNPNLIYPGQKLVIPK
jgi:LysM repeat protein